MSVIRNVPAVASRRLKVRIEKGLRRALGRFGRSYYKVATDEFGRPQVQLIRRAARTSSNAVTHGATLSAASRPYPAPPTVPNDITPANQAIYVPAVSPGYAKDIWSWGQSGPPRTLPNGVSAQDLDFLDPANNVFRISHALTSAGVALTKTDDNIICKRSLKDTRIIADSGGYQVASNTLKVNSDQDRLRILRWQEQFDVAVTLDAPTGPLTKPGNTYAYKSTNDCLAATIQHLDFYERHKQGDAIWLNVLQGNNQKEADVWYDNVRRHFKGQGWAFAGPLRHNFFQLLRRILIMYGDGEIQEKRWIHVLGTSELGTAVLLTALQRAINEHMNPNIRISYDTSSPFRNLAYNNAYTIPNFGTKDMTMPTRAAPDHPKFIGSPLRWPWPSPLGDQMVMGDFCVPQTAQSTRYRDTVSNHMLAHHNLAALCWGIALANRIFDAETASGHRTIALPVGLASDAIEQVISTKSMNELYKNQSIFGALPHGQYDYDSEEERDF